MKAQPSHPFVFMRSDRPNGAWALYAPNTTSEEIASGKALPLVSGTAAYDLDAEMWTRPNGWDYRAAKELYDEREGIVASTSERPEPPACKVCEQRMPREKLDTHHICLACRIASDPDIRRYHAERARRRPHLYPAGFDVVRC